jgi:endonuclease YncB( thermonuclease family)
LLKRIFVAAVFALIPLIVWMEPIASFANVKAPRSIQVIDGDTISSEGKIVRLVGFDTPEAGMNAKCEAERALATRATFRLRQLVAGGGLSLTLVPCACRAGTEGTQACNYGRACGTLSAAGRDVGAVLIGEGLAKPYHCSGTRCPRREPWC